MKAKKSNRRAKHLQVKEVKAPVREFKPYSSDRTFRQWHAVLEANLLALMYLEQPEWRKDFGPAFYEGYRKADDLYREDAALVALMAGER